jgi:hypothetical protein
VGPKINALVRKAKEWLGKCKIGMSDKSETARGEVRKRVVYAEKAGQYSAQPRSAAQACTKVQPSQRMDVAKAVSHPAAYQHQPQASSQGSPRTLMTSSQDWQSLACRSWRSDTKLSAEFDSGTADHPRSSLHHMRAVRN